MRAIIITLDGRIFDCPVHALHLSVRLGVPDLGQAVLYRVFTAHPVKDMLESRGVFLAVCQLYAVIRQNGVDFVRQSFEGLA